MKAKEFITEAVKQRLDPKCWKGKHKEGTKIKGGVRVNNCVPNEGIEEAGSPAQQAAIAINMKKHHKKPKNESLELAEEFDMIERIIEQIADQHAIDVDLVWEDLSTLTDDELYVFAVTSEPIMEDQGVAEGLESGAKILYTGKDKSGTVTISYEPDYIPGHSEKYIIRFDGKVKSEMPTLRSAVYGLTHYQFDTFRPNLQPNPKTALEQGVAEDWQKANKRDKTDGMSKKAVNAYRRENPGSKLKTAVTTKPSKLKRGSKASKRRSSYCSRSAGQQKMHNISCSKTPDKAICKARRRWNC